MDLMLAAKLWSALGVDHDMCFKRTENGSIIYFIKDKQRVGHFTTIKDSGFHWDYPQELVDTYNTIVDNIQSEDETRIYDVIDQMQEALDRAMYAVDHVNPEE